MPCGTRHREIEPEHATDLVEVHLVIAWIIRTLNEGDLPVRQPLLSYLDEIEPCGSSDRIGPR